MTDGRVDPTLGGMQAPRGSISHQRYNIWHLNQSYQKRFEQSHDHPEAAAAVPRELAVSIQQLHGTAQV